MTVFSWGSLNRAIFISRANWRLRYTSPVLEIASAQDMFRD